MSALNDGWKPRALTTTSISTAAVSLSWTSALIASAQYNIYRNGVKLNSVPQSATTFNDITVTRGFRYLYRITGTDGVNESDSCQPLEVSVPPGNSLTMQVTPEEQTESGIRPGLKWQWS